MGAEIIFMPHVTGCLPSVMPGRGVVDPELWDNRDRDPVRLRQEYGVYMLDSSRINVAGINARNIDYVAESVSKVL